MLHTIHSRHMDQKQMHKMAVIRNKIIHVDFDGLCLFAGYRNHKLARRPDHQAAAVQEFGFSLGRLEKINIAFLLGRRDNPHRPARIEDKENCSQGGGHKNAGTSPVRGPHNFSGKNGAIPNNSANDRHDGACQKDNEKKAKSA